MVPSPCVSVCAIDPQSGYCFGCLRTLEEVAGWATYDEARKLAILAALATRRIERRGEDDGDFSVPG